MCSKDGLIKKRIIKLKEKDILADYAKLFKSSTV